MKTAKFFGAAILALFSTAVFSQEKNTSFKVSGNCGMCKRKIETAAKSAGAKTINWEADKQLATVSLDTSKVSLDAIQRKIADAGYDTEKFIADDKAYNSLPGCCQYERAKVEPKKSSHQHE